MVTWQSIRTIRRFTWALWGKPMNRKQNPSEATMNTFGNHSEKKAKRKKRHIGRDQTALLYGIFSVVSVAFLVFGVLGIYFLSIKDESLHLRNLPSNGWKEAEGESRTSLQKRIEDNYKLYGGRAKVQYALITETEDEFTVIFESEGFLENSPKAEGKEGYGEFLAEYKDHVLRAALSALCQHEDFEITFCEPEVMGSGKAGIRIKAHRNDADFKLSADSVVFNQKEAWYVALSVMRNPPGTTTTPIESIKLNAEFR